MVIWTRYEGIIGLFNFFYYGCARRFIKTIAFLFVFLLNIYHSTLLLKYSSMITLRVLATCMHLSTTLLQFVKSTVTPKLKTITPKLQLPMSNWFLVKWNFLWRSYICDFKKSLFTLFKLYKGYGLQVSVIASNF